MYKREAKGLFKHFDFLILDFICLQVAFCIAYICRNGWHNPYHIDIYKNFAIVLCLFDFLTILVLESLKNILKRGYLKEAIAVAKQGIFLLMESSLYMFSVKIGASYSRIVVWLMVIFYIILDYFVRIIWKKVLLSSSQKKSERSIIIITTKALARETIKNINQSGYKMFEIAGLVIVDEDMTGGKINGIPVLANYDTASNYVCRNWVDEALFVLPPQLDNLKDLAADLMVMGVVVHIQIGQLNLLENQKQFVEKLGNYNVLTLTMNYMSVGQTIIKRFVDIIAGLIGTIFTGIIYVFIAPVIKKQSPGPVFFKQVRIGKNGKRFTMYKFRSMYLDAEERKKELMAKNRVKDGMMFKLDFDPRIIGSRMLPDGKVKKGIGNYIRDLSIDEFPQFINILKGDMSLIGTRPPTVDEWEKYEMHHRARMAMRPGLTGMWQTSGRSNITDFEEVVKLDTQYINNWSLSLDLKIMVKTFLTVLKREGSM